MSVRVIKLDAAKWRSISDFYDAILAVLEAPHWHGRNVAALVDSIWGGSINGIEPPYKIWIVGTKALSSEIREQIDQMIAAINFQYGRTRVGNEPEIKFQIDP
jgi:RNAse (barnase) inhibitor barstar